ncbi:family 20 glycosylhydrolase [Pollutibacter soli]|uniref:family 20 glycosylhydrolase n=1 Tax=Pollutibacter soli TaxID=3034157 RepID=UPI0030140B3B
MKIVCAALFVCSILFTSSFAQSSSLYPLIPYPQELIPRKGHFNITSNTVLVADQKVFSNEIQQLKEILLLNLKMQSPGAAHPESNYISFESDPTIANEEGYSLDISTGRIIIKVSSPTGLFRALQSLRQLTPVFLEERKSTASISIPCAYIKDYPVYAYRGMHLDVSRHFFSMDYLRIFVDRLALYKFNKFHLHLTDDQGWRIEIKRYPLLTEKAAWRKFNNQDTICMNMAKDQDNPDMNIDPRFIKIIDGQMRYGGFYTQEEMRSLVQYAAARHIDIIPEIDMPGHMDAAIQLYPFLSCTDGGWKGGPFTVPICPCKETTYEFAENVYKEIFDIFPYEYVHLGADEVNKTSWKDYAGCADFMKKENIGSVEELQSYFVKRMGKFFNAHGKKLIGWDEILEGGVSSTAYVMYWRSWVPKAPVEAAKNGNKVIMTPGNPLYFDAVPDQNSMRNVYQFNPVPAGLNEQQAANIIGAQANIWTEWIPTEARLEYMTMPRMLALPEVLWTNRHNDYEGFQRRVMMQYKRLDALKTKYRLPDIEGLVQENVFVKSATFSPKPPAPGLVLRYTTDGKSPNASSPVLDKPFTITRNTNIKIAAFNGKVRGDVNSLEFKQQDLTPAVMVKRSHTGLDVFYFTGSTRTAAELKIEHAKKQWIQKSWEVNADSIDSDVFGLVYTGVIRVPKDGVYSFYLTADDGAVLKIANQVVVDNDGLHSAKEKSGQIALQKGMHFFELKFIEGGGGYTLNLEVQEPGAKTRKKVPDSWFE